MPSAGFEPTIPASERPQTLALDRAVTGIGLINFYGAKCSVILHDFRGCNLSVKEGITIQLFGWKFFMEETIV
jgi:hypothetical protein